MFDDEARAFLSQPRVARISTLGSNGYPNTVPVWFGLDGDEVVVVSERRLQKVRNLQRNPKGAVQVGGDSGDEAGYLIRGEFTIADDVGHAVTNRLTYHYEDKATADQHVAEWADLDMVVLRMKPVSVTNVFG